MCLFFLANVHVAVVVKPMGSHFGVGAPPILEPILVGDWDVHWGYGVLTHGHVN